MEPNALTIATELVNGSALLRVVGDVDLSSADHLRDELDAALRQFRLVVVDVAGMSFIDSSGLNALVRARRVAQECASELRLRHPTPTFLQLLEITRLETVFVIDEHDRDAADTTTEPTS
jgi:anti-anti-sigma factor